MNKNLLTEISKVFTVGLVTISVLAGLFHGIGILARPYIPLHHTFPYTVVDGVLVTSTAILLALIILWIGAGTIDVYNRIRSNVVADD